MTSIGSLWLQSGPFRVVLYIGVAHTLHKGKLTGIRLTGIGAAEAEDNEEEFKISQLSSTLRTVQQLKYLKRSSGIILNEKSLMKTQKKLSKLNQAVKRSKMACRTEILLHDRKKTSVLE